MVALHHDPFALLLHNRHATLISLVYLYTCPSGAERVPTCTFMVPEAHGQRHCAVWILLQMGVPFLYLFFFFCLAVSCKSVRYTCSTTPKWNTSALIYVRADGSACTWNVLWEYVHCMSMSPHVNSFFYAFRHAKHSRSFAGGRSHAADWPGGPRSSFVLIPKDTDCSSHPTQNLVSTPSPPRLTPDDRFKQP